ncbi:hypothetical protein JTE90_002758 [Oedothorax gibbosus]|uniref:AB hydrolase-1 domain-containing protein n=1 Tax=Oedothorax gibbosus TaxID=931172 RepID=A0AAV6UNC3_9ARAC|nr:hypothetical protein JTE90_002758 [Oedothorax gibbosus]
MASKKDWGNPKEIRIPVSYGSIAAKAWGNENDEPVLAFHGWQDNAGTYDKLIPLLNSDLYIVAIDTPGHGLSSHKPYGSLYNVPETALDFKKIVDYLKWERFSIIGHSMGGQLSLFYTGIFPEQVKNLILLDIVKPPSRNVDELPGEMKKAISEIMDIEKKMSNPVPVYSPEEAKKRLIAGMYYEVTPESADILLKRGCKPSDCGKGVVFTRDIRVKVLNDLLKFSHEAMKSYMKQIICNMLIILGTKSVFRPPSLDENSDFFNIYKKHCKSLSVVQVEGNHFVHLNNAERIAHHIDAFFKANCNNLSKI